MILFAHKNNHLRKPSLDKTCCCVQNSVFKKLKYLQKIKRKDFLREFNELVSLILSFPCDDAEKAILPVDSIKSSSLPMKLHYSRSKTTLSLFSLEIHDSVDPGPVGSDPDDGCKLIVLRREFYIEEESTETYRHFKVVNIQKSVCSPVDLHPYGKARSKTKSMIREKIMAIAAALACFIFLPNQYPINPVNNDEREIVTEPRDNKILGDLSLPSINLETMYEAIVIKDQVHLREGPSTDHTIRKILPKGQALRTLLTEGDWVYVDVLDEARNYGWVYARLIVKQRPLQRSPGSFVSAALIPIK